MPNIKEAYATGKALGYSFVQENWSEASLEERQHPEGIASEVFENYQQFSPWESTASEFNASRNHDRTWEAFERGMDVGARQAARELMS